MKFGDKLQEHVAECKTTGCRGTDYVDYEKMKLAIKDGATAEEFQTLFQEELTRFTAGLNDGALDRDPLYTVWNRTALDKLSKKYDKRLAGDFRAQNWKAMTAELQAVFRTISIDDWSLIPPDLKPHTPTPRTVIFFAGGASGIVSRTMTAPLDRIKLMLQAGAPGGTRNEGSNPKEWGRNRISRAAHLIYRDAGVTGFWRGNMANVMKVIPESAFKFLAYDVAKSFVTDETGKIGIWGRLVSGCAAGAVSQLAVYPLDVTKTRLAVSMTGDYNGIWDCISRTVRHEGFFALYRGVVPALVGIIPAAGIDLALYNTLREKYMERLRDKRIAEEIAASKPSNAGKLSGMLGARGVVGPAAPPIYISLAFGATSAICGSLLGYPLTLIRTRLMAQGMPGRPERYRGMVDCFRSILRESGFFGLYRGLTPALLKTVPAVSIGYGAFETAKGVSALVI